MTETCPEISVLSAFFDGELEKDQNQRVQFHAQSCSACADRLKRFDAVDQLLVGHLGEAMTTSNSSRRADCVTPEVMTSYFHDLLSGEEKKQVEAHLDLCDDCLSEFASLAKAEMRMEQSKTEPLPNALRERVKAFWTKEERAKEPILRLAVRLASEGLEIIRDSLFPHEVSMQEVFAPAGVYRATPKSSLPSGVLLKRDLPGIQLSVLLEWEKADRAGLRIKIANEKSNPVAGQRVLLRQEKVFLCSERTDADGAVTITNLEPGVYQLGILTLDKEFYVDLEINKA